MLVNCKGNVWRTICSAPLCIKSWPWDCKGATFLQPTTTRTCLNDLICTVLISIWLFDLEKISSKLGFVCVDQMFQQPVASRPSGPIDLTATPSSAAHAPPAETQAEVQEVPIDEVEEHLLKHPMLPKKRNSFWWLVYKNFFFVPLGVSGAASWRNIQWNLVNDALMGD